MRTPRLYLGILALALLLPLLLLACGGSDEPTDGPSSERATGEPTDLPDSERATDEPETPASPAPTPSTPGSGDAPTATEAPAAATAPPTATDTPVPATATSPPAASGSVETDREALVAFYNATYGEKWKFSRNWLSDAPLGQWSGVTTDDDGRVIELTGIPQIKPPFLDIAPAGIPPNIMPHSKGVKCGLMRPDSLKFPAFIGQPLYCQA